MTDDKYDSDGLLQYMLDNGPAVEPITEYRSYNGISFGLQDHLAQMCNDVMLLVEDYVKSAGDVSADTVPLSVLLEAIAKRMAHEC